MKRRASHGLILSALLLGACTTTPPPLTTTALQDWQPRMAWLQGCPHWQLSGKMGLRLRQQAGSLYIDWRDDGRHWDLQASGPLGEGAVHLYGDPHHAILDRGAAGQQEADSAEDLLAQQMQLHAPISSLRLWLLGRPGHTPAQVRLDATGRLRELQEQDYDIQYLQFSEQGGAQLPSRIHIHGPQLEMLLVIHHWTLPASCRA